MLLETPSHINHIGLLLIQIITMTSRNILSRFFYYIYMLSGH